MPAIQLHIDPAAMTAAEALKLARAAGGWSELREKVDAYGAPAVVALRAYDLAQELSAPATERQRFDAPAVIASYLALRYSAHTREAMGALYLDSRNRLISEEEIFTGGANRCAVEPREILRRALLAGAVALVVYHNHPSGDPSPSPEDLSFTRRLAEGGELVGVRLLDHIVTGGPTRWVSLRERGAF